MKRQIISVITSAVMCVTALSGIFNPDSDAEITVDAASAAYPVQEFRRA